MIEKIIELLAIYSILMTILYQVVVLKNMFKTKKEKISFKDILIAIPFGAIVLLAVVLAYIQQK